MPSPSPGGGGSRSSSSSWLQSPAWVRGAHVDLCLGMLEKAGLTVSGLDEHMRAEVISSIPPDGRVMFVDVSEGGGSGVGQPDFQLSPADDLFIRILNIAGMMRGLQTVPGGVRRRWRKFVINVVSEVATAELIVGSGDGQGGKKGRQKSILDDPCIKCLDREIADLLRLICRRRAGVVGINASTLGNHSVRPSEGIGGVLTHAKLRTAYNVLLSSSMFLPHLKCTTGVVDCELTQPSMLVLGRSGNEETRKLKRGEALNKTDVMVRLREREEQLRSSEFQWARSQQSQQSQMSTTSGFGSQGGFGSQYSQPLLSPARLSSAKSRARSTPKKLKLEMSAQYWMPSSERHQNSVEFMTPLRGEPETPAEPRRLEFGGGAADPTLPRFGTENVATAAVISAGSGNGGNETPRFAG